MADFVFKRYEMKYLLTEPQYRIVRTEIEKRLEPDRYGDTTIQSLYYDTPDCRLVRASIDKPVFKEKLRLRCYGLNDNDRDVYLEMKRKYDGVVYKRRVSCKETEADGFFRGQCPSSQIGRELQYFISCYPQIAPKVLILYDRSAFFDTESDLRVTFDSNIRFRADKLRFSEPMTGEALLPPGAVLMELKTGTGLPLWLTHLMGQNHITKCSFSKYGEAYRILNDSDHKLTEEKIVCLKPYSQKETLPQRVSSSF